MKSIVFGMVVVLWGVVGASALWEGEVLRARIFPGEEGNPNAEGQGWYQANRSSKMGYFENPARWASSETPGDYPYYLYPSYVQESTDTDAPEGALWVSDANMKNGVSWVFIPSEPGRYRLSVDGILAYANGGGNPQTWGMEWYHDGVWTPLMEYVSLGSKSSAYGTGTNIVVEAQVVDKLAFVIRTGGGSYNGGAGRVDGLRVERLPGPQTVLMVR